MNTSVKTLVLKERHWALKPFRCFVHATLPASILAHLGVHGIEARSVTSNSPIYSRHKFTIRYPGAFTIAIREKRHGIDRTRHPTS